MTTGLLSWQLWLVSGSLLLAAAAIEASFRAHAKHIAIAPKLESATEFDLRVTTKFSEPYAIRDGKALIEYFFTNGSDKDILINDVGIYYFMITKGLLKGDDDYLDFCVKKAYSSPDVHDIIAPMAVSGFGMLIENKNVLSFFLRPLKATNGAGRLIGRNLFIGKRSTDVVTAEYDLERVREGYSIVAICTSFRLIDAAGSMVTVVAPGIYIEDASFDDRMRGTITSSAYGTYTILPTFSDKRCSYSKT
ncbi:MAG: hypothetical protein FD139_596 [Methylocystaceae bacterium]|nr:MAG: hypothetical protein FD148_726 [Methylocystaceae bacterium]KAF0211726.1 MAG: hypothetical protein FD172_1643 [Methylocystaceae bacterium]TXT47093.1 MAG: hypothetical protein FD139_596 [Methylocystaceae bacterium]